MNTIKKIAAAAAAVLCLTTAAGCSSEKGFMGNTEEVALRLGMADKKDFRCHSSNLRALWVRTLHSFFSFASAARRPWC
ncbi:MAG: hypothetical protein K2N36_03340 [Ruminiclostridium sp.]|nr:hypothetical protein [Ruminiclostridium sp.]